jgi:hypothetical protein
MPKEYKQITKDSFSENELNLFWSKVDKSAESGCWNWVGPRSKDGFGIFRCGGEEFKAHRISYSLNKGEVEQGKVIAKTCQNNFCVNPEHLIVLSIAENNKLAGSQGKRAKGAANGKSTCPNSTPKGENHWMKRDPNLKILKIGGENNSSSKLTEEQVLEIRKLYDSGSHRYTELAIKFGVAPPTIRKICMRVTWTHV